MGKSRVVDVSKISSLASMTVKKESWINSFHCESHVCRSIVAERAVRTVEPQADSRCSAPLSTYAFPKFDM